MRYAIVPWICMVLVGSGCDAPTAGDSDTLTQRAVGIVHRVTSDSASGAPPAAPAPDKVISAPDTVDAGVAFQAIITTSGANTCWRAAGADVRVDGSLATVVPYDRIEGEVCALAIVALPRPVNVRFDRRGDAILRVEGRQVVNGQATGATVRVEKRITVR